MQCCTAHRVVLGDGVCVLLLKLLFLLSLYTHRQSLRDEDSNVIITRFYDVDRSGLTGLGSSDTLLSEIILPAIINSILPPSTLPSHSPSLLSLHHPVSCTPLQSLSLTYTQSFALEAKKIKYCTSHHGSPSSKS